MSELHLDKKVAGQDITLYNSTLTTLAMQMSSSSNLSNSEAFYLVQSSFPQLDSEFEDDEVGISVSQNIFFFKEEMFQY